VEEAAWKSYKKITTFILGNYKAENYSDMVVDLVKSYKTMGYKLSLKVHFFDSNSNFSSENLGTVSNEHGE
jgi:hypothetical protein